MSVDTKCWCWCVVANSEDQDVWTIIECWWLMRRCSGCSRIESTLIQGTEQNVDKWWVRFLEGSVRGLKGWLLNQILAPHFLPCFAIQQRSAAKLSSPGWNWTAPKIGNITHHPLRWNIKATPVRNIHENLDWFPRFPCQNNLLLMF